MFTSERNKKKVKNEWGFERHWSVTTALLEQEPK